MKKNIICFWLFLLVSYVTPSYAATSYETPPYDVLTPEEWESAMEGRKDELEASRYNYRGSLESIGGLVREQDSIFTAIQEYATILWNRDEWMEEDVKLVSGIVLSNGRKLSFLHPKSLIGYDPKEKVLYVGYGQQIYCAIDLLTGWDKPLDEDIFLSSDGRWRVIYLYHWRSTSTPFIIQQYDEATNLFLDICPVSTFAAPGYHHFSEFCWKENILYIHFSDSDHDQYVKVNFDKI